VSEFNYIDIFATKGFEYLLVIGFFLLLVGFWSFLNVPKKEIRKARAEREELRRLLSLQHERMEDEMSKLRDQRDDMQNALLAHLRLVEQRAAAAWRETHPDASAPPDLGRLLDWVLAEHDALTEDRKRLDYLTHLVQWKTSLYRAPGSDGSIVVDASGKGFGEAGTLRGAIDAARSQDVA
jgi:hypothetical protein